MANDLMLIDPSRAVSRGNGKAIKGMENYSVFKITAKNCDFILTRAGRMERLVRGDVFAMRAAGSAPDKFRIVLPEHGVTKVFSVDYDQARAMVAASQQVEPATSRR